MPKITPKEVLSFEISKKTVPGVINRISLRWNVAKMCREHSRQSSNEICDLTERHSVTNVDYLENNQAWQNWENEENYFNDRLEMRKEIICRDAARIVLDRDIGTSDFNLALIDWLDQDLAQLTHN